MTEQRTDRTNWTLDQLHEHQRQLQEQRAAWEQRRKQEREEAEKATETRRPRSASSRACAGVVRPHRHHAVYQPPRELAGGVCDQPGAAEGDRAASKTGRSRSPIPVLARGAAKLWQVET